MAFPWLQAIAALASLVAKGNSSSVQADPPPVKAAMLRPKIKPPDDTLQGDEEERRRKMMAQILRGNTGDTWAG